MTFSAAPTLTSLAQRLKVGQRYTQNLPVGSADALLLTQLSETLSTHDKRLTVVLCEHAQDAQRLQAEMAYFAPHLSILQLPDWETLPYDRFSPHHDLVSERLQTLYSLTQKQCDILIVPVSTALYRLSPPDFLLARTFSFKQNEKLDAQLLREQLVNAGYQAVSQVIAPGEFAFRGGLIDLFPMGSVLPFRLDLFGDTIESIKTFDVDSQRTLYPVPKVQLLPGREYPTDEAARGVFRNAWREKFEGDASKHALYKDVANGIFNAGIEYYLPLFFEQTATIFDYIAADATIVLHGLAQTTIRSFWTDTAQRYAFLKGDNASPVLPPEALFLNDEQFFAHLQNFAQLSLRPKINDEAAEAQLAQLTQALPDVRVNTHHDAPFAALTQLCKTNTANNIPTVIFAESLGRQTTLSETLERHGISVRPIELWAQISSLDTAQVYISHSPLERGFTLSDRTSSLCLITETELYAANQGTRARRRSEKTSNVDMMIASLSELRIGDPVVHQEHGIGRYQGLMNMDMGDGVNEFLHLVYANDTALYVPVSQLSVISRYAGHDPEHAPLHTLGTDRWQKARKKAAEQIRDTAAELLNLYARRALRKGHAFELSANDYEVFANDFGFETTPDQASAIAAVVHDLVSDKPMDRLVCGDVGFGKTEVALRAAFIAAMGGKQVAILAPTTLLAEQHFQTFSDRFSKWPIKIAEVSRFNTGKETTQVLKGLAEGTIDIVVGTHKLLSDNVAFERLGLVIIDEEHRFGVRQKEMLKNLRAEVDILTMTATPIPRTMSMAMEGVRDLSIIATAPQKRLAIKTFVRREENGVIREAILRELKRGGQVYFLHNEVSTIENRREQLEKLIPEARIAVAHGQMHERDLERVMRDFYHQRANILLCTTIIETGIDVPNANTIIMHRADKFGLGQLHQLRGRVGRSHHQAYAYLLIHHEDSLTNQATRRLDAICQMEELGSGFFLAMQDMEIRGAGEILGDKQSGNMHEIGFTLYNDMLNAAIKAMRKGIEPDLAAPLGVTSEINLHTPALLPAEYCHDVNERLNLYKRLASTDNLEDLLGLQEEMIDRFGAFPPAAQALLETHKLRLRANEMGLSKIDVSAELGHLHFSDNAPVDGLKIIQLIQKDRNIQLNGNNKLKITSKMNELSDRVARVHQVLDALK
ncbi:transcription-repair coupling factor [Hydromonas duriensis]|uniref:Transcription-repair-coupling factor n=1 Tax=Hydromonas duriensis TaxID=1527608 RepID=A0A4R6Y9P8_9BURK|nr:transcription-repair coupling factor [Hydromonas duriensis]TDR32216.1 transcription-repair coupling factor [Hydromonas duriensis]